MRAGVIAVDARAAGLERVAALTLQIGRLRVISNAMRAPNEPTGGQRARGHGFAVGQSLCRRGDLNPHAPKGTSPSIGY